MTADTPQSEYYEGNLKKEDQKPTEGRESCRNFVKSCRENHYESAFLEDKNTLMEFISSGKSFKVLCG